MKPISVKHETSTAASNPQKTAAEHHYQQNVLVTAKGGSLSFVGRVFEYLVRFIFSILVARTLLAEGYGLYTLGLTVVTIVPALSMLGLQTGMVRYLVPAIAKRDEARMWGVIQVCLGIPMIFSLLLAMAVFLLAEPIALAAFKDPRLPPIIRLLSICIPLDTIIFLSYVIIISFKRPKYSVLVNDILMPLMKLICTVGFLLLGWGTIGAVLGYVVASAVGMAASLYFVNLLFPLKRPFAPAIRETREILRYSLPVYLAYVLSTLRGTLETLVLGFIGLTTGVGIYSVALRLSSIGSMVYLAIGNISTPIIAELNSRGERAQLKSFYQTTTKWILTFNIPLFLTFIIFGKPILSIFGPEFTEGSQGLLILALGSLVYTGTGVGANILDMTDHTRLNSINSAIMVVVTIVLDLLLIPRLGVLGAAAASSFSTVVVNLICMVEVFALLKMLPYSRTVLKLFAAAAVAGTAAYFISQALPLPSLLLLFVGSLILWGIYFLALFTLGISAEDQLVISNIIQRIKMFFPSRTPAQG